MEADFRLTSVTAPDIQTEVRDNQPIRGRVQISMANKKHDADERRRGSYLKPLFE